MEPISNITNFVVNPYYTLIIAVLVIALGHFLTEKITFLKKYSIPQPVTGGLVVSFLLLILYYTHGVEFQFHEGLKNFCMLSFFASAGLSVNLKSLAKSGKPLAILVISLIFFVFLQDIIGVMSTYFFEPLKPLHGLILGSIPLVGGHSTAGSWGSFFEGNYGLIGASTISMTAATYGLVAGGLLGGPIANLLMRKGKVTLPSKVEIAQSKNENSVSSEGGTKVRLITASSTLEVLGMVALCLSASYFITNLLNTNYPTSIIKVPPFVWTLFTGVILRNILSHVFNYQVFDRNIDIFGNVTLYLFLAVALISLKLYQLSGLSYIITIVLLIETLFSLLYIYFITFNVMGRDYDAAIICAGQCGFGLGAMPTAIANMQALTEKFGPSPKAFLIIPVAASFFMAMINTIVLTIFQYFLV
ncbi:MAG: sodium/glutamate symporter [Neisseriaceae bacterium]|nr:MAG: sodium/glutamate symporter [Neisseriaceae bacterium]